MDLSSVDSYRQREISKSDWEIASNCGKTICSYVKHY